jgi:ABC-type multidrug transport system ATPase subunit
VEVRVLIATGLEFSWSDGPSLGPIDAVFGAGVHRITGPNGRGKTTLLRLLCGALPPSAGTVTALGRDVRADPGARAAIGFVPSTAELPDFLTVDEAWQMLAAVRRAPAWDGSVLRERLGLRGGVSLGTLSAGQRRRAEILAQLAGDPPILLLDEPFADLDPDGVAVVREILVAEPARTILYIHHGPSPLGGVDHPIGEWTSN